MVLDKGFVYSDDSSLSLEGLGYKDLEHNYPRIASKFANYNLSVMSVITDLFVRLNTNKSLTGAEIRNAMSGEVPKIIRRIADHRFFKSRIKFQTSRGQDKNAAAKLMLIEFLGKFTDTKLIQLNRFVDEGLKPENADIERAVGRVEDVLNKMSRVFLERDNLLSSQGPTTLFHWDIRNVHRHRIRQVREFWSNSNASDDQIGNSRRLILKKLTRQSYCMTVRTGASMTNLALSVGTSSSCTISLHS